MILQAAPRSGVRKRELALWASAQTARTELGGRSFRFRDNLSGFKAELSSSALEMPLLERLVPMGAVRARALGQVTIHAAGHRDVSLAEKLIPLGNRPAIGICFLRERVYFSGNPEGGLRMS